MFGAGTALGRRVCISWLIAPSSEVVDHSGGHMWRSVEVGANVEGGRVEVEK
jgi:hypothetical protein